MSKFEIGGKAKSWLQTVTSSTEVNYDGSLDPRNEDGSYLRAPSDAGGSIVVNQSIGDGGRGSAVLSLPGNEIPEIVNLLRDFNPEEENTETLTVSEIVKRTLRMEYSKVPKDAPEGTVPEPLAVCFATSLRKHTREIRIPVEHFAGFCNYLSDTFCSLIDEGDGKDVSTIERAVVHYRAAVEEMEEADRKKAAKLAAAAAKALGK